MARAAGLTLQNQVQHGHEMALTAPETPVQVGRLAGPPQHCAADEHQGRVKARYQLGRDDVIGQHHVGALDVLRQPQDEIALLDSFRNVDQVFDQGHGTSTRLNVVEWVVVVN